MGFGTLFIGYFLLLNITYFAITDMIAALIMAMGLYNLSPVNRYFKGGFYIALALSAIGLFELCVKFYEMFFAKANETFHSCVAIPRYVIIAVLTLFILLGIKDVAYEVDLRLLAKKAERILPFALLIYLFAALLEIPGLDLILDIKALAIMSVICLILIMITVSVNLTVIYKAYMKICMPGDDSYIEKKSRFAFVNKFREHTDKKQQEYRDYKLEKSKKNNNGTKKRK